MWSKTNLTGHGSSRRSATSANSAASEPAIRARYCRACGQKYFRIRQRLGRPWGNGLGFDISCQKKKQKSEKLKWFHFSIRRFQVCSVELATFRDHADALRRSAARALPLASASRRPAAWRAPPKLKCSRTRSSRRSCGSDNAVPTATRKLAALSASGRTTRNNPSRSNAVARNHCSERGSTRGTHTTGTPLETASPTVL